MRTFENLVKRINLVENAHNELPEFLDYNNAFLAYKMQIYLKRSYRTLCLNRIRIKRAE